ncbi:MAG: M28 family peptidase [Anaerolineaceae bacterium]|nr:M28 family peptidase [Anaerolineaceae bacterium]
MLLLVGGLAFKGILEGRSSRAEIPFSGDQALIDVAFQVALGPRTVGSQAHDRVVSWMESELSLAGWQIERQEASEMGHPIVNVVAKRGNGKPWIILGAHYDSRLLADQDADPAKRTQPVDGANDGASGVAVLLGLARSLPKTIHGQIWLVMIDNEDNGDIPGWDWLLGSRAFVKQLQGKPDAAVIIDMIGDADLNIYMEKNSNRQINIQIWGRASSLGYEQQFINSYRYQMIDDHVPFLNAGIPAVDIIDFDYPFWHTTHDTLDKVSAKSLQVVGDTLRAWLLNE